MISLDIRALMCVPLVFHEQRQGALYVDARAQERPFARGDLRFFEAFADMLSIVWTNRRMVEERIAALRMQRDLELVREIQASLIPEAPLREGDFTLCGRVIPATEAGGDAFDYFRTRDGRLVVAVGDVSGHGAGPALFMAGARAYLRSLCQGPVEPGDLLEQLNRHLVEDMGDDMFMSFFLGVLDPGSRRFTWANAGHPPPVLVRADGSTEECRGTGMALGVEADLTWGELSVDRLEPGDTVVMVTDGVLELRQGDEQFGRKRLADAVCRHRALPASELVDQLVSEALAWSGRDAADDDVTVAVVRAEPS
jgi:sigma-B regulation protein RsbU (phosphoserine phosphatase)